MSSPNSASSAATAGDELVYTGETVVVFANATYQFVVLRHFLLPAGDDGTSDGDVLAMLIQNPHYRGSFVGTGDGDTTIHGPYQASAITTDSFVAVAPTDAETLVRRWAEYAAPLPEVSGQGMDREVYPRMRAATSLYQLVALPQEAFETEWRLGIGSATGFHEFVALDRLGGTVTLVMATDD
ncbi:hypothetical protein [Mycolicibacterium frederiksbergense]|uniref:Uncharacterized protein n=1 Tax=Mycolicibacterium frederiksbergense TaxID=117567 RepID=A0A6H0RXE7_9MYCO|nr:hypothetical protein [Mycolicibacterium frederiksbergense]QIV79883.1 hypothetical protein EXE63_02440 [Mycolicibacterium frederiksbergense]